MLNVYLRAVLSSDIAGEYYQYLTKRGKRVVVQVRSASESNVRPYRM